MIYLPMSTCSRSESSAPKLDSGRGLVERWSASQATPSYDREMMWTLVASILRQCCNPSN